MMLDFDSVRTLRDEQEYEAALKAVRPYFDREPDPGTPEAENFDALFLLIEDYEDKQFPVPAEAEPAAVVKQVMTANHYTRSDLVEVIGSKARASELLNGRREISLDQIRRLNHAWGIPAGALIGGSAAKPVRTSRKA